MTTVLTKPTVLSAHIYTQLQAKRRHKRLTDSAARMADIMTQDLSTYQKTNCKICGKGTAIALLCCNNHINKFATWGEVL
jgi:hypothetical protein